MLSRLSPVLLFAALGCARAASPCLGPSSCPSGSECFAARCVPVGKGPVPLGAERVFASPSRIALATRSAPRDPGPSAALGTETDTTLYLDFPSIWRGRRIDAAFLVLSRTPMTPPGDDVPLEVLRIQAPWSIPVPTRGHPTRLALPRAEALAHAFPELPIRIDVTALVRHFAHSPADSHGLAVRATRAASPGIAVSTGLAGTPPPRLEVYVYPD